MCWRMPSLCKTSICSSDCYVFEFYCLIISRQTRFLQVEVGITFSHAMFLGFWIKKSSWPLLMEKHIVRIYLLFLCYSFGASFTNFNGKPICEYNNWRILHFYFWWRFLYIVLHNSSSSFKYTFSMLFAIFFFTLFLFSLGLIVTIFCAYCTACFLLSVSFHPMLTQSHYFDFHQLLQHLPYYVLQLHWVHWVVLLLLF